MRCKIKIESKQLISLLGNKSEFNTIEEIQEAFKKESSKHSFLKFNTQGKDFTVPVTLSELSSDLSSVKNIRQTPILVDKFIEYVDTRIVQDAPVTSDAGFNNLNVKITKPVVLDENPLEFEAEEQNKVKYKKYQSTSVRDLNRNSKTFYDSKINENQRQLKEDYRDGKYPDAKLVLLRDRKEFSKDPNYKGPKDGVVGILVNNPKANMSMQEILANAVKPPYVKKGEILSIFIENPDNESFFGGDNTDETSRSTKYYAEAVRVRNKEQNITNADELFIKEAKRFKVLRDYAGVENADNFVIMGIDEVSVGSRDMNTSGKSIERLKLKAGNIIINDSEGSVKMTFQIGNQRTQLPVTGSKLSLDEINFLAELWEKQDQESIALIIGASNKNHKNGFKFTGKSPNKILEYTSPDGTKLLPIPFNIEHKNMFIELLKGSDKKGNLRSGLGLYKRNISYKMINLEEVPSSIREFYNVLSNQKEPLLNKLIAPKYLPYREFDGRISPHPSNVYFYLSEDLETTVIKKDSKEVIPENPLFDEINSRVPNSRVIRDIPNDIREAALLQYRGKLPPAFSDGTNIYVVEDINEYQLIEEKLHVLTKNWLKLNKKSDQYNQLLTLHTQAVTALKSGDYDFTLEEKRQIEYSLFGEDLNENIPNIEEFVARGISNPETVEFLKKLKTGNKKWFDTYYDIIKSILEKLGIKNSTIYSELLRFNIGLDPSNLKIAKEQVKPKQASEVEISSNAKGLEAALTNFTESAKSKGNLVESYPVTFNGKNYKDVEAAYQALKDKSEAKTKPTKENSGNYRLMVDLISAKLEQHPRLVSSITKKGGVDWISSATHQPTKQNTVWETGGQNWFIEALADAYRSTQQSPQSKEVREVAEGIKIIDNALTSSEELEIFKMIKPFLESQGSRSNKGKNAPIMIGMGLRWDYKSNNPGKSPVEIKETIVNSKAQKNKYAYYDVSIDGQPLGEIPARLKELMTKATGVDASNYDGAIINIYPKNGFISAHNDVDESATAINYPVIVANIGGAGSLSIEGAESQKARKGYSSKEYVDEPLSSGSAYIFGEDGKNRKVFHRTLPSAGKGNLPQLNVKGQIISANSYRISVTLRRVKDLDPGMPISPAKVSKSTQSPQSNEVDLGTETAQPVAEDPVNIIEIIEQEADYYIRGDKEGYDVYSKTEGLISDGIKGYTKAEADQVINDLNKGIYGQLIEKDENGDIINNNLVTEELDTKETSSGEYYTLVGSEKEMFLSQSLDIEFGSFLMDSHKKQLNEIRIDQKVLNNFYLDLYVRLKKANSPAINDLFTVTRGADGLQYLQPNKNTNIIYKWISSSNSVFKSEKGFKINEEDVLNIESQESGNDFKDKNNVSLWESSDKAIKDFMRLLPEIIDGKIITQFGLKRPSDVGQSYGRILYEVGGSNTMTKMYDTLNQSKNTFFKYVAKRLLNPETANSTVQSTFWVKFYQKFRQTIVPVMTYKEFIGGGISYFSETGSNLNKIKNSYQNNFENLRQKNPNYFLKDSQGIYASSAWKKDVLRLIENKNYTEALELMGFEFLEDTKNDDNFLDAVNDLFSTKTQNYVYNTIAATERITNPIKQLSVKDDKGNRGQAYRIKTIIEIEAKYSNLSKIVTTKNANNENVQANSLPNSLTQVAIGINNPDLINSNNPESNVLYSNLKTPLFESSKIKEFIDNNENSFYDGPNIELHNINGSKNEQNQSGTVTRKLSDKDWTVMQTTTLLTKGVMEMLRQETASSSWGFKMSNQDRWVEKEDPSRGFLEQYKKYFFGEVTTIKAAFEEISKGTNINGYTGNEFQIFSEILKTENPENYINLTEEQLEQEWENNVKAKTLDYLNNQKKEITEYFAQKQITSKDLPHLLDKTAKVSYDSLDSIIEDFAATGLIYGVEQSIAFYGGLEHWSKFYKRNKGAASTGPTPVLDSWWWKKNGEGKMSNKPWSKLIRTFVLKEDAEAWTETSPEFIEIAKQFIESLKKSDKVLKKTRTEKEYKELAADKLLGKNRRSAYGNMEIADGQGYINLDFYRIFLKSVGNWDYKKDEELYNWEAGYYNNVVVGTLTAEEYINKAGKKPDHAFSVLKTQYFGGTDAFAQLNLQVFDKFSLAPLIPSVIHNRKFEPLMKHMASTNTGYVKFESASKAAINNDEGKQMSPVSILDPITREAIESFNTDAQSYNVHVGLMKEQLKTNSKYKSENIFGSQFRKLLVADMTYVDDEGKLKFFPGMEKLYYDYTANLDEVSRIAKEDLYDKLKIEELVGKRVRIKDYRPLLEMLEKEVESRELLKTVKDFIKLNLKEGKNTTSLTIPFEASGSKQTLENIIAGLINKKLIRQKVNGAQLIQMSSTGLEPLKFVKPTPDQYSKYGATGLKYYQDGKAAEVKIAMSKNFMPLIKKYGSLEKLNEALKETIDPKTGATIPPKEVVNIIGYRIPTQGLSSMDSFNIQEFLPQSAGNIIVTPLEIVAKSGADYDIDKMSFIFPQYDTKGSIIKTQKKKDKSAKKKIKAWYNQIDDIKQKLDDAYKSLNNFKQKDIAQQATDEINRIHKDNTLNRQEAKTLLEAQYNILKNLIPVRKAQNTSTWKEIKALQDHKQQTFEKLHELNIAALGVDATLNNERLDIISKILLSPINYHQLIKPLGTDIIKSEADDIADAKNRNKGDKKGKIVEFGTHVAKRKSLMGAQRLLGVTATATTFLQLFMKANIKLNSTDTNFLLLDEKYKKSLKKSPDVEGEVNYYYLGNPINEDGDFKSEVSNQNVNGTVDAAADDFLGKINYTQKNIGMIMYLNLVGVSSKKIMNFVNQPVIDELIEKEELGEKNIKQNLLYKYVYKYLLSQEEYADSIKDLTTPKFMEYIHKPGNLPKELKPLFSIVNNKKQVTNWKKFETFVNNKLPKKHVKNITEGIDFKNPLIIKDSDYYLRQIITLVHYKNLSDQSSSLYDLQSVLSPDTNFDRNPLFIKEIENTLQKVKSEKFVSLDSIDRLINESSISSFFIRDEVNNIYKALFPIQYDPGFIESVFKIKDKLKIRKEKTEKYFRVVANDYLLYKVIKNSKEDLRSIYTNFYSELIEFKGDHPELNLKILNDLYEGLEKDGKDPFSTIELRDTTSVKAFKDIYTEGLEILNKQYPEFTDKLIKAGFYQSGFNKTYFSWAELIPPSLLTPILKDNLGDVDLGEFEADFIAQRREFATEYLTNAFNDPILDKSNNRIAKFVPASTRPLYININDPKPGVAEPEIADLTLEDLEINIPIPKDSSTYDVIGDNKSNEILFTDDENGKKYLMNDDQQEAYNFLLNNITDKLQKNKKEKLTGEDFLDTQEFTSKLSEKFSGIIPKKLFDNMFGLQGYGGTGKTTMTKKLLDDIQRKSGNAYSGITTKFIAPTHQAATQLMESLGLDSEDVGTRVKTVASYLRMQVQGSSNQLGNEQKWSLTSELSYINRVKRYRKEAVGNPSVIIMDEASMSGKGTIKALITRLTQEYNAGLLTRFPVILFLGDYHQLPPIKEDGLGIISATVLHNAEKSPRLEKVMRSKNKGLADLYLTVAGEIDKYIDSINAGDKVPYKMNTKAFEEELQKQNQNILKVTDSQEYIQKVQQDYADYLADNLYPDGMFYIHFNRQDKPETKRLEKSIREKYLKKLQGKDYKYTEGIVEGDYIIFAGDLPLRSVSHSIPTSFIKNKDLLFKLNNQNPKDTVLEISSGVFKPKSRYKVLETINNQKLIQRDIEQLKASYNKNAFYSVFANEALFESTTFNSVVLFNRQQKLRADFVINEVNIVKTEKWIINNKHIGEIHTIKNSVTGKTMQQQMSWDMKEDFAEIRKVLDSTSNKNFKLSYVGSSHSYQGAGMDNVIASASNILQHLNKNVDQLTVFTALYTALTRTKENLLIVTNQENLPNSDAWSLFERQKVSKYVTSGIPTVEIENNTPNTERANTEFDFDELNFDELNLARSSTNDVSGVPFDPFAETLDEQYENQGNNFGDVDIEQLQKGEFDLVLGAAPVTNNEVLNKSTGDEVQVDGKTYTIINGKVYDSNNTLIVDDQLLIQKASAKLRIKNKEAVVITYKELKFIVSKKEVIMDSNGTIRTGLSEEHTKAILSLANAKFNKRVGFKLLMDTLGTDKYKAEEASIYVFPDFGKVKNAELYGDIYPGTGPTAGYSPTYTYGGNAYRAGIPVNPKIVERTDAIFVKVPEDVFLDLKETYDKTIETITPYMKVGASFLLDSSESANTSKIKYGERSVIEHLLDNGYVEIPKKGTKTSKYVKALDSSSISINGKKIDKEFLGTILSNAGITSLNIDTIIKIQEDAKFFKITPDEKYYYDERNPSKKYQRLSNAIGNSIDTLKMTEEAISVLKSGSQIGTNLDEILRDYFDGVVKKHEDYRNSDGTTYFKNQKTFFKFMVALKARKDEFIANGETIFASNIFVYNDELKIAGTLDILTINKKGEIKIYDLKTRRRGNMGLDILYDGSLYTQREKYVNQTSGYGALLELGYNLKSTKNVIDIVKVNYTGESFVTDEGYFQDQINLPIKSVEEMRQIFNMNKDLKLLSDKTFNGTIRVDSRASRLQVSDKLKSEYNKISEQFNYDTQAIMMELNKRPEVTFESVFKNELGEDVGLLYLSEETDPSFTSFGQTLEGAKVALFKDAAQLPDLDLDSNDINNIKNCK